VEKADLIVLGLGPAGASAAAEAARHGCKVVALDRRREAGLPVQCAELVPALLEVEAGAVRQQVGAMVTFVEDEAPDVSADFPGRMLDRAAFDAALVEAARRAGAQIRFSSFIKKVTPGVELADGSTLRAPVIIGADGPRSRAGKAIGSVNTEVVETRQVTVPLLKPHAATDIFLSAGIPGGYGWLFPKGEVANLGAGVSPAHKGRLKSIVSGLHSRLAHEKRVERNILALTGGAIPVGGMLKPRGRLENTAVLLAGDAAGLANPVTGAGIAAAVHSGRLAGQAAVTGKFEEYEEELEDVYRAALDRALARRRELMKSKFEKAALRRGWIAYPEYWQ
jgi:geranylgeranyl reductase family protein